MSLAAPAPASVPFAPTALGADDIADVVARLESEWLSTGPRVVRFERAFADYVGAPHALAVNSSTAALHLALLAAGVEPGHEVVTTPLTFCATANVVIHAGAIPVFADVDPITGNLNPEAAAAAVTDRTRVILPVHYAGRPAAVDAFATLASIHRLKIVEDAAHCVEGVANGRTIGSIADFSCFSLCTTNLTTGEGGMVTARSERAMAFMRVASLHGMSRPKWTRGAPGGSPLDDVILPGFDYTMMDLQAAIGLHRLARLASTHARRQAIWARYDAGLANLPLRLPAPMDAHTVHARRLYTVLVDEAAAGLSRDELHGRLHDRGIFANVHFRALHLHPYYEDRFGFRRGMFPAAEAISDTTLSLPLSAGMADEAVDRVIEACHDVLR